MSSIVVFLGILLFPAFILSCAGLPLPETEVRNPTLDITSQGRAGENSSGIGGISSAMNNFQSGISTFMNASNMKDSKLVMGGFSFFIIPSPDMQQLAQLNPGIISQLPSFPGKK